ncbi:DUF2262 domain-containing protein [Nocardioides litoris]|uniref:DUF2262 domain-containing protein n=1 Tax=Nocardioides litoris TaxID=1926648 RepID=UPI0014776B31|nr:DUF2262 domain-containing protein [Nocardioides litoris]
MDEAEQREAFDGRHVAEPAELTVLTGDWTGGGHSVRDDALWTRTVTLVAHVDEHGALVDGGRLTWLVPLDQRGAGPHALEPHTQYVVRGRRSTSVPASLALDEVVGTTQVPALDERLARWTTPTVLASGLAGVGDLTLTRSHGWFGGTLAWGELEVGLSLDADPGRPEGAETCDAALARLGDVVADLATLDARWRTGAATHLLELARHWQDEADGADGADEADEHGRGATPLTADALADRIRLASLSIGADGSVTPDYDDGDVFWGHAILLQLDPDLVVVDAEIAG